MKSNTQLGNLKHCTLDICGDRVLCVYLPRRLDYALLCRYWLCTLLLFSTRLPSLLYIILKIRFRPHQQQVMDPGT
jgi:hypothetical protein